MGTRAQRAATGILLFSVASIILIGARFGSTGGGGEARTPSMGDVVAKVPSRAIDPATREIDRLHTSLRNGARDPAVALRLARLHMDEARRTADPRHFGYAEAVLTPLCEPAQRNPDALVLRAMVHQARHKFELALVDLDRALQLRPIDPQAWLVRGSILTVLGRYEEASQSCDALAQQASRFVSAACRAPIEGVQGKAQQAISNLHATLGEAQSPSERAWGASLLGDLASWSGDNATAEQRFREALALDPEDRYSRGAYADLLLETGRAEEARKLLSLPIDDEGLLVRLAIADHKVGADAALERRNTLRARFDADRRRGEPVHGREETRFALAFENEPERALALALENWAMQHEPWDARLVMEAALAAGKPEAATPALAWVKETGFEDARLRDLSQRLERTQ